MSHAGADGRIVDALVADGVQGLVVAATGNGTLHYALHAALERAQTLDPIEAPVRALLGDITVHWAE